MTALNVIIFLLINIIDTYTIVAFLRFFFDDSPQKRKAVYVIFAEYYCLSAVKGLFIHDFLPELIVSLLIVSVLAFCYRSKAAARLLAVVSAVSFFMTSEMVIRTLTGTEGIALNSIADHINYGTRLALLTCIIRYSFVQVVSRFRNLDEKVKTPVGFLIITVSIPVISVVLELLLLMQKDISDVVYYALLICVILLNYTASYLYGFISNLFSERASSAAAEQKSVCYMKEAELMQKNSGELKKLRHDMKNHLIAISELAKTQDNTQITEYTDNLLGTSKNHY